MSQTITIGPLAIPLGVLLTLGALWLGWFASARVARARALHIEPQLYVLVAMGVLAARLGFVLQYSAAYLDAPLSILDVRDGGWRPVVGLLAAAAAAVLLAMWRPATTTPLAAGLATVAVIWVAGTLALGTPAANSVSLPQLTLPTVDGRPVALEQFKGKPVVLNLWATWCPPCLREMPVLQRSQQERGDVHFVFVNQGEQAGKVQAFLAAHGLALRNVLLDSSGQAGVQLGYRALPTTLFFDAKGRLVDTRVGELSHATLSQRLEALAPSTERRP